MEVDEINDQKTEKQSKTKATSIIPEMDFSIELLKIYYDKAFPYELMYKWLSYFKVNKKENKML